MNVYHFVLSASIAFSICTASLAGAQNGVEPKLQVAGLWDGFKDSVSGMGRDIKSVVSGKGRRQTPRDDIQESINQLPPAEAGQPAKDSIDIREIQAMLTTLGFSPGPVAGMFGAKT